jgi:hypothetical protein
MAAKENVLITKEEGLFDHKQIERRAIDQIIAQM